MTSEEKQIFQYAMKHGMSEQDAHKLIFNLKTLPNGIERYCKEINTIDTIHRKFMYNNKPKQNN